MDPSHQPVFSHHGGRIPFDVSHKFNHNFIGDMNGRVDGHNFLTIPEHPGNPHGDDTKPFLNFLGLDGSHGNDRNVDLNSVSHISKQFGLQGDSFDPMARHPQAHGSSNPSPGTLAPQFAGNPNSPHSLAGMSSDELHSALASNFDNGNRPSDIFSSRPGQPDGPSRVSWGETEGKPVSDHLPGFSLWNKTAQESHSQHHSTQTTYPRDLDVSVGDSRSHNSPFNFSAPVLPSQHADQDFEMSQPSSSKPRSEHQGAQTQEDQHDKLHISTFDIESASHSDSPAAGSAESVVDSDLQSFPRSNAPSKPPTPSSNLAARRHRRPAALGTTYRSNSYNLPGPNSPHGNSLGSVPDANLRRIKSSTAFGGRIQKSSQRSPFHRSFAEASGSPIPFTHGPVAATTGEFPGTAPITPISEMNPASQSGMSNGISSAHIDKRQGECEHDDLARAQVPQSADPLAPSPWSMLPDTGATFDTARSYASPPHTPMDSSRMASMHISGAQLPNDHVPTSNPMQLMSNIPSAQMAMSSIRDNQVPGPPQNQPHPPIAHSAPPWQQSFPSTPNSWPSNVHAQMQMTPQPVLFQAYFPPCTTAENKSEIMPANPTCGGGGQSSYFTHPVHTSSEFPAAYRQQYLPGQPPLTYHVQSDIGNFVNLGGIPSSETASISRPISHSPAARSQPELQVHHYSPPHRAESTSMPQKTRSTPQERREFNFQNTFSESFASSPSSS